MCILKAESSCVLIDRSHDILITESQGTLTGELLGISTDGLLSGRVSGISCKEAVWELLCTLVDCVSDCVPMLSVAAPDCTLAVVVQSTRSCTPCAEEGGPLGVLFSAESMVSCVKDSMRD